MYPETMLMIFTLLQEQEEAEQAPPRPQPPRRPAGQPRPWVVL